MRNQENAPMTATKKDCYLPGPGFGFTRIPRSFLLIACLVLINSTIRAQYLVPESMLATNITCDQAIEICDNYDAVLRTTTTLFTSNHPDWRCIFEGQSFGGGTKQVNLWGEIAPEATYLSQNTSFYFKFKLEPSESVDLTLNAIVDPWLLDMIGSSPFTLYPLSVEVFGPFGNEGAMCANNDAGDADDMRIYGNRWVTDGANDLIGHPTGTLSDAGWYLIKYNPRNCHFIPYFINIHFSSTLQSCTSFPPPPCETCIQSFAPYPGEEYVVSAWAREKGAPLTATGFSKPFIEVRSNTTLPSTEVETFFPDGAIIDGWQRIEGVMTIPSQTYEVEFALKSTNGEVLFDDVRVHPLNGRMKTFVYDPYTMRLVAEQDEHNYSTFYEYDDEGKLSRVKKETERGVKTIQAIRQNNAILD